MKRFFAAMGVSILLILVSGTVFLLIALNPECGEEVLSRTPSPDGDMVLIHFTRDCGATTATTSVLAVAPTDRREMTPRESDTIFVGEHLESLNAQWIDARHIRVTIPTGAPIFKQESRWNDIAITYE